MLISIIVPAFNSEKNISRCLESLMKLKSRDVEILVINDGSTDKTKEVCEKYISKDDRLRLINQKNTGVSGARNTGIRLCRGKYVAFVDSDDEITEKYNEIIDILRKEYMYDLYAFDFSVQTCKLYRRHDRVLFKAGKNEKVVLYNNYLKGAINSSCINIYRADIIKKNNILFPIDMKMGEDTVFNGCYLKWCENVYYINEIGYIYYTDDQGSASYANKISYLQDFVKVYDKYLEIYYSCNDLEYPCCAKYHINNIYGILKRHWRSMTKEEKEIFRKSAFCNNLLTRNYKSWKHEVKKVCIFVYLYLL